MMMKSGMWSFERIKERFSLAFYAPFLMMVVALLAGGMFGLFGLTILTVMFWILLIGLLVTVVPRYRF
ncbi:MAG TPA: hypothetical protein VKR06_41745 [Ktedonosporobacter sp.]|nr:hypothetical protein [Ktedonosporobacter sp.]